MERAICVQLSVGSLNPAIHNAYHTSLHEDLISQRYPPPGPGRDRRRRSVLGLEALEGNELLGELGGRPRNPPRRSRTVDRQEKIVAEEGTNRESCLAGNTPTGLEPQILSFRPKGLYGTMCHPDFLAQFVVQGLASMSGLISSWRPWAYPA